MYKRQEWYARAAIQDDGGAKDILSILYGEDDAGIESALKSALEWYERLSAGGNAEACFIAGRSYKKGPWHRLPGDSAKALEWYRKAAALGNTKAMCALGRMHLCEKSIPEKRAKAVKWYEKAAEAGDSDAMYELYEIYKWGTCVPQDPRKARGWLKKAAAMGHDRARFSPDL